MRYSLRQKRLREQRAAFFFFCGAALAYLIAGVPIVTGALASHAREAARHSVPGFAALDRNHDGYIDSSEAAEFPAFARAFSRADADGDGRLAAGEFAVARRSLERAP